MLQTGRTGTAGIRGMTKGLSLICMDKYFHTARPKGFFELVARRVARGEKICTSRIELHEEKRITRGERNCTRRKELHEEKRVASGTDLSQYVS